MADSNCSASDIAEYLSSRGCTGTLTDKRLKYHLDDVRKDFEDFTAIPKPGESEAAALLRVLNERNCRFIYLYTNAPSDHLPAAPSTLSMATSDLFEATIVQGQPVPAAKGFLSEAFSKLSAFFTDAWSGVADPVVSAGPVAGERKVSDTPTPPP